MGTSSLSNPITFSGSSTFSSSFQQVLTRAVSIASLPMMQMQNDVNRFQGEEQDLSSLQATFSSLQNSLQDVAAAVSGSVSATSSNLAVATATASASTLPGNYSVEVDDIGSATTTLSNAGTPAVTDPASSNISSSLNYTLTVNGAAHTLSLSSDSMQNLASAINASGAGVQATIVNLGSNASPDYRLSVTSTNLGADTIDLSDGTTSLLNTLQTGSPIQYKVNGSATTLTSNTNQVTLAPGLTATLVSASVGQTVNITVSSSEGNLSSALSNFATAYNSAAGALASERGQTSGALSGQGVIYTLSDTLSQIMQYVTSSGSVQSLSDLGLNLDSTGNISFNPAQFSSQSTAGIQQFLGTVASGGFLQYANNALTSAADPTTGVLANELTSVAGQITNENSQIADQQTRVNNIQTSLQAQLSAADAAIAVLQQQKTYFTDLFAAEYLNNNVNSGSGG